MGGRYSHCEELSNYASDLLIITKLSDKLFHWNWLLICQPVPLSWQPACVDENVCIRCKSEMSGLSLICLFKRKSLMNLLVHACKPIARDMKAVLLPNLLNNCALQVLVCVRYQHQGWRACQPCYCTGYVIVQFIHLFSSHPNCCCVKKLQSRLEISNCKLKANQTLSQTHAYLGGDPFFCCKNNSILGEKANCSSSIRDGCRSILNLV